MNFRQSIFEYSIHFFFPLGLINILIHVTRNNHTQKVIDTPQFLQVHLIYIEEYAKRIYCTHELQKKEDARNCNADNVYSYRKRKFPADILLLTHG